VVKKVRRQDEGQRETDAPQEVSEKASDIVSSTKDENGEQSSDLGRQASEKKAASPGPSEA